jgi:uncharacterized protein (DUF4415 family)
VKKRKRESAKVHVNLRLAPEVLAYFKQFPNYTGKMREVLTRYAMHEEQHT